MNPSPGPWRGTQRGRWIEFIDAEDTATYVRCEDVADGAAKDNAALIAAAPEMREMLLKLEWIGKEVPVVGDEFDYIPCCPLCGARKGEKLHVRCTLAALLERLR